MMAGKHFLLDHRRLGSGFFFKAGGRPGWWGFARDGAVLPDRHYVGRHAGRGYGQSGASLPGLSQEEGGTEHPVS